MLYVNLSQRYSCNVIYQIISYKSVFIGSHELLERVNICNVMNWVSFLASVDACMCCSWSELARMCWL